MDEGLPFLSICKKFLNTGTLNEMFTIPVCKMLYINKIDDDVMEDWQIVKKESFKNNSIRKKLKSFSQIAFSKLPSNLIWPHDSVSNSILLNSVIMMYAKFTRHKNSLLLIT